MCNAIKDACLGIKVSFLALGFKGYKAFKEVCRENSDLFEFELYLFWHHNTYSDATLNKIDSIITKLKTE